MTESKIELTERLRREGRDEEARQYREKVRTQLRAEGTTRREAMQRAWQATRLAFPLLPPAESTLAAPPVEPAAVDGNAVADEDWVLEWFSPLSVVAEWQAKHGVSLTDQSLTELLQGLLGFGYAWAWLLGARGELPPSFARSTGGNAARVAALIDRTFEKMAEAVTVEELATFRRVAGAAG